MCTPKSRQCLTEVKLELFQVEGGRRRSSRLHEHCMKIVMYPLVNYTRLFIYPNAFFQNERTLVLLLFGDIFQMIKYSTNLLRVYHIEGSVPCNHWLWKQTFFLLLSERQSVIKVSWLSVNHSSRTNLRKNFDPSLIDYLFMLIPFVEQSYLVA